MKTKLKLIARLWMTKTVICGMIFTAYGAKQMKTLTPDVDRVVSKSTKMIADFEGFRSYVYVCPGGKQTIGYGFTRTDLIKKGTITRSEADAVLKANVTELYAYVRRLITRPLTEDQWVSLISFTYNVGRGNFASSTLLKNINRGSPSTEIAAEINKWVYSRKVKLAGLVKRRAKEAKAWA